MQTILHLYDWIIITDSLKSVHKSSQYFKYVNTEHKDITQVNILYYMIRLAFICTAFKTIYSPCVRVPSYL